MNFNLSYLNVIEMLKFHRLSQCLHTTNKLVMLILLENEELNYLYSSFNYCEYLFHSIGLSLYALKQ